MNHWGAIASVIVGVLVTALGLVLGWYVFPNIVDSAIEENVVLKNGTEQFERFEKLPIPLDFKVYIFNVNNTEEVSAGKAKPQLEERGPYIYKQTREKTDIVWNTETSLSYYEYTHFEFSEEESGELKEEDEVTILNPALNSAIQMFQQSGLNFVLEMINRRVKAVFNVDESIFMKTTVKELLFDGIEICNLKKIEENDDLDAIGKIEAKIVCLAIFAVPQRNIVIKKIDEKYDTLMFSFVGHKKDKHDGHYTINTGIDDVKETALIEEWEDKPYLTYWNGGWNSSCNEIKGRDAVIFEPHLTEKSVPTIFNTDICRTIDLHYSNDVEFRDVTALEFRLGAEALRSPDVDNEDEMCYCLEASPGFYSETGCLQDGMLELFSCYNVPVLMSYPHFLWASQEYQDAVENLKPDVDKHKTFAILEPNTGTPLQGSKRVQFNMFVNGGTDENNKTIIDFLKGFEKESRLIPIIWLDEGFTITDDLYDKLYDMYISKTILIAGFTWGLIGVGIAVVVITLVVVIVLKRRDAKQTV